MKKILAFILCAILLCAMPIVASAEESLPDVTEENEAVTENLPTTEEIVTESEISADTEEVKKTTTEIVVDYVKSHVEELSVMGTLLLTIFYEVRKHGKLNGSIGILNNNAVTVAENSAAFIKEVMEKSDSAVMAALLEVKEMAETVKSYKEQFETILNEIKVNATEKQSIEEMLRSANKLLETSKAANIEFADELAELLTLANIPNSVKDKLYARHRAAVDAISAAEEITEVNVDDGQTT